jgi:hypothetical protein
VHSATMADDGNCGGQAQMHLAGFMYVGKVVPWQIDTTTFKDTRWYCLRLFF